MKNFIGLLLLLASFSHTVVAQDRDDDLYQRRSRVQIMRAKPQSKIKPPTPIVVEDCAPPTPAVVTIPQVRPRATAATIREYIEWNPVFGEVYHPTPDVQSQAILRPNGGADFVGGYGAEITSLRSAAVAEGLLVEWEVAPNKLPPTYFSVYPEGSYGHSGDFAFIWQTAQPAPQFGLGNFDNGPGISSYRLFPEGFNSERLHLAQRVVAGDRIGILIRPDGVAEYHINFESCKPPVFVSQRPVQVGSRYRAWMRQNSGEVPPYMVPGVGFITAAWRRSDP